MTQPRLQVAVVGLGRAGRARVRALERSPRAALACVVRRTPDPSSGVAQRRFFEVIEDPLIAALILCTPNLLHASGARAALEAGKHVAVEFPLAASATEARELFELARRSRRILHVEHIELLSPSQRAQRALAGGLGRPAGGSLRFSGGLEGWIGDAALAGSHALRAEARLQRLVDLFGPAEVRAAELGVRPDGGYRLRVDLSFAAGGGLELVEQRGVGLARWTRWEIHCERGLLRDPPPEPPGELFAADLERFLDRIETGAPPYVSEERVLHVLDLVDRIEAVLRS